MYLVFTRMPGEDAPLVEIMYLVFTRMLSESYRRLLGSLLYLCYVFRPLILTPLSVDSARALWVSFLFRFSNFNVFTFCQLSCDRLEEWDFLSSPSGSVTALDRVWNDWATFFSIWFRNGWVFCFRLTARVWFCCRRKEIIRPSTIHLLRLLTARQDRSRTWVLQLHCLPCISMISWRAQQIPTCPAWNAKTRELPVGQNTRSPKSTQVLDPGTTCWNSPSSWSLAEGKPGLVRTPSFIWNGQSLATMIIRDPCLCDSGFATRNITGDSSVGSATKPVTSSVMNLKLLNQ